MEHFAYKLYTQIYYTFEKVFFRNFYFIYLLQKRQNFIIMFKQNMSDNSSKEINVAIRTLYKVYAIAITDKLSFIAWIDFLVLSLSSIIIINKIFTVINLDSV